MNRSVIILLVFALFGCQNQDAVSEEDGGSILTSGDSATNIKVVFEGKESKVDLLQFLNGKKTVLKSLSDVSNEAEFNYEFSGLSLVYLKLSSREKLIPVVIDQQYIEIKLSSELESNSKETSIMWDLDEYYRTHLDEIKSSPTEFISKIDSVSPSFSGFSFLATLQRLSNSNFKKVSTLAKKHYATQQYSSEWTNFVLPQLDPQFLSIGSMAPDFTLKNPSGKDVKLSDFRGKVLLLDFWATWCGPCMHEMPNVKKEYVKYKEKGFEVLGVSLDREEKDWKKVISARGFNWNHVLDENGSNSVARLYNVRGIPFTLLIDKEGRIIGKNLRGPVLGRELAKVL